MHVTSPVDQRIHQTSEILQLYYPSDNRAFNIHGTGIDEFGMGSVVPNFSPIDTTMLEKMQFTPLTRKRTDNSTILRYAHTKHKFPIITIELIDNTIQVITFLDSPSNYRKIEIFDVNEYSGFEYLKEYQISSYQNKDLININYFKISDFRLATDSDMNIMFNIPKSVPIEERYLN